MSALHLPDVRAKLSAAEANVVEEIFQTDPISALGLPPPISIGRDATVGAALAAVQKHGQGYVLVVDSSHFGFTDRDGRLVLNDLPNETVKVTVWHPDLDVEYGAINRTIDLSSGRSTAQIRLDRVWHTKQEASLSWNDY